MTTEPLDLDAYLRSRTRDGSLRMDAYYYGFEATGVEVVDRILSAVACAGKSYHHTESWTDSTAGPSPVDVIQQAAQEAAADLAALAGERAAEQPQTNQRRR